MKLNNFSKLVLALFISGLAGLIAGLFAFPIFSTWYSSLAKPAFTPSNTLFISFWFIFYILLGISAFLVWRRGFNNNQVKTALAIFIFQLVISIFWPLIFFGVHNFGLALMEIASLWFAVLALILSFYELVPIAAYILIPYILWLSFIAFFNYSVWHLSFNNKSISPVVCSTDVKVCPDGLVVRRTGPNCSFATCSNKKPLINSTSSLANPASENCVKVGGKLVIKKDGAGGEYSLCELGGAYACEEWALFRGDCPSSGVRTTGFDTIAQKYCAWLGGQTLAVPNAVCTFKDGSTCLDTALYQEKCHSGQNK